jgi:hypothetical protein
VQSQSGPQQSQSQALRIRSPFRFPKAYPRFVNSPLVDHLRECQVDGNADDDAEVRNACRYDKAAKRRLVS